MVGDEVGREAILWAFQSVPRTETFTIIEMGPPEANRAGPGSEFSKMESCYGDWGCMKIS